MFVPDVVGEVRGQREALAGLVAGLDPDALPAAQAMLLHGELDRLVRLASAARTLLARRVDDTREWQRHGYRNPVEHLAATTGTSLGQARRELDTSRALPALAATRQGLLAGTLSPDQGEVIADAAATNPAAETALLGTAARSNLAELRQAALRAKAAADPDPDATHARLHQHRRLTRGTDPDGAWTLFARGTADQGAVINSVLDPLIDELFHRNRTTGVREQRDRYAFDALVELARRAAGVDRPPAANPHPGTPGAAAPAGRVNPRFLALLRVDVTALRRGTVAGEERCEITGVGPVPVRVARDLLGQAILKLVITQGVDVVNVTSLGRGPSAAMKVALAWTSPTCTVEGCSRTHVETDHRLDWAHTHHTRLDELDQLCDGHHDLKTHHGWALVEGNGKRPLVPPDHPRHPTHTLPTTGPNSPSGHGPPGPDRAHNSTGPLGRTPTERDTGPPGRNASERDTDPAVYPSSAPPPTPRHRRPTRHRPTRPHSHRARDRPTRPQRHRARHHALPPRERAWHRGRAARPLRRTRPLTDVGDRPHPDRSPRRAHWRGTRVRTVASWFRPVDLVPPDALRRRAAGPVDRRAARHSRCRSASVDVGGDR